MILVSEFDIPPMAASGKQDWVLEFGKEGKTMEHRETDLGQELVILAKVAVMFAWRGRFRCLEALRKYFNFWEKSFIQKKINR